MEAIGPHYTLEAAKKVASYMKTEGHSSLSALLVEHGIVPQQVMLGNVMGEPTYANPRLQISATVINTNNRAMVQITTINPDKRDTNITKYGLANMMLGVQFKEAQIEGIEPGTVHPSDPYDITYISFADDPTKGTEVFEGVYVRGAQILTLTREQVAIVQSAIEQFESSSTRN